VRLKMFLVPCTLIAAPGIVLLFRSGPASIVGALLIVLGGGGAALAYLFEKRSVRNKRAEYEYRIQAAFESLHCRDNRVAEFDENGFAFSCRCGVVTRPWSELLRFSESNSAFFLSTKAEGHVIPKSAFPTEGAVTEFRALLLEKIEQQHTVTAHPIEFKYENADYRHAILLHIIAGGGWRRLARKLLTSGLAIFAIYIFWDWARTHGAIWGVLGGILAVGTRRLLTPSKGRYLGRERLLIHQKGMQIENGAGLLRVPWTRYAGFLEGNHVFLLYYATGQYRLIPKRAAPGRDSEIRAIRRLTPLLRAK